MKKRCVIFLLAFILNIMPCIYSYAAVSNLDSVHVEQLKEDYNGKNFVVLGDSIGAGYLLESPDECYGKLLSNQLNMNYKNIAVNGITSEQLLDKINNEDLESIKNADVINISIGGNDIMQPILKFIREKTNTSDLNKDFIDIYFDNEEFFGDLLDGKYDEYLNSEMEQGLMSFSDYFPKIINRIREINKSSKIIIQTISNPLCNISYLAHVSDLIDNYLCKVNGLISKEDDKYNVVCSDIYGTLKNEYGYNISNILNMDIHPNKVGHYDIYLCIYKLLINEYPNDINVDIKNCSYRVVYNQNILSPEIYFSPNDGYTMPMYINVTSSNDKKESVKCEKCDNGEYKCTFKPHQLYGNIKITGNMIDVSGKSENNDNNNNGSSENNYNSKATNTISNGEKDNNALYESGNEEVLNSVSELTTSDYLNRFLMIFAICFIIVLYRLIKYNIRKEK